MTVVNKCQGEITKGDMFKLTLSPAIEKMKDFEGEQFDVASWVVYSDVSKKDPETETVVLSIMSSDGSVKATNSPTFMDMFLNICNIMENELGFKIEVVGGESKNGRHFITCDLVL